MTSDTNCTPVTPAIPVTSDTPVTPAALARDTPAAPANVSGAPRGVDILISYLYGVSVHHRPGNASVVH